MGVLLPLEEGVEVQLREEVVVVVRLQVEEAPLLEVVVVGEAQLLEEEAAPLELEAVEPPPLEGEEVSPALRLVFH